MQASELSDLAFELLHKLRTVNAPFERCLGGNRKADEMLYEIGRTLYLTYYEPMEGDKKIDKQGERRLKQGLYRIETLVREIEAFFEEGEPSSSSRKSFKSSANKEMELILEDLKPHSSGLPWLFATEREIVVGEQFMNQRQQIIESLLDSDSTPVIPISGKPGSGKSTLARLALGDSRVRGYFHSRLCVNLTFTPGQDIILEAIQRAKKDAGGRKFLLVLDDVSNEDVLKSLLVDNKDSLYSTFLEVAARGSKIVITSNLDRELQHFDPSQIRLLESIGNDESWELFQKIAFPGQKMESSSMLITACDICGLCDGNPGVINIVASILNSKPSPEKWVYFIYDVMTSIQNPITVISSVLDMTEMHCHHPLQKKLRHCFAWCSLLPKDYEFTMDQLFRLWRAQEGFGTGKVMTDLELDAFFEEFIYREYFIKGHSTGSVLQYKISHLVYELMKYVAGDDFCLVDKPTAETNHKIIRHVSFIVDWFWQPPSWLFKAKQLQSLLLWPRNSGDFIILSKIDLILSRMAHIRTLHAEVVHGGRLPKYLSKLDKLNCLSLGAVSSVSLPDDIPSLHKLLNCDLQYTSLIDGNLGLDERLALFLHKFGGVRNVAIKYDNCVEKDSLEHIHKIIISLISQSTLSHTRPTIESLEIHQWKEEKLPVWAINETSLFLRSLLSIQIANCSQCRHLPGFNTLPHLSSLQLGGLYSLVDIVISGENNEASSAKIFYPSLKCLVLYDLPELKGWLSKEADDNQCNIVQKYCFPLLTEVKVKCCPKLISIPSVPMLESLEAIDIHANIMNRLISPPLDNQESTASSKQQLSFVKTLEIDGCKEFECGDKPNDIEKGVWHALKCLRSLKLSNFPELMSFPNGLTHITTLEKLSLCWLTNLKVLPEWIGKFTELRQLNIHYCPKLTILSNSDGSFSTLEQLEIRYCPRLSQFPESFPNLKRLRVQEFSRLKQLIRVSQNLEELEIDNCEELILETQNVEDETSFGVWEGLKNLHSLKFTKLESLPKGLNFEKLSKLGRLVIEKCPKLTELPESLGSLPDLEHLRIQCCPGLTNLPKSFSNLNSLKQLEIRVSPKLQKRCQKPSGEDWCLIQHIPNIVCGNSPQ